MILNVLASTMLLLLSPGGAIVRSSSTTRPSAALHNSSAVRTLQQTPKSESRNTSVWSHSDDGVKVEVRVEGEVEFTDDYADVKSISQDGLFVATDERGGETRKLRVTPNVDGTLRRSYSVDGHSREFDADARAWLSRVLADAARDGGLDAQVRARRILRERGAKGLLEEVRLLRNDYARRVYLETLIKEGNPDGALLENILRQASAQISSDYESARLLIEFAKLYLGKNRMIAPFFEAAGKITSDFERVRVLSAVLKNNPNREVLAGMLESARSISSDYEKARFLLDAMPLYLSDASLRSPYLDAISSISSDYERGRVLTVVSKKTQLN
jgi:hypothetical protein